MDYWCLILGLLIAGAGLFCNLGGFGWLLCMWLGVGCFVCFGLVLIAAVNSVGMGAFICKQLL